MTHTFDAVYEDGVLKPAGPLPLKEHATVRVTIEPVLSWAQATAGMIPWKGTSEELQRFLEDADFDSLPDAEQL
jgi:predicted DNA-binding antitoxin AbrB/MazE fold protein